MPDKSTIKKAQKDKEEGKSASTQAGEFVHDEIEKVKKGKHGVRNAKQAIAIGLSEARRAGIDVPDPKDPALKKKADQDKAHAKSGEPVSKKRSAAITKALKKEPTDTVSSEALSKQAKGAAKKRTAADRSESAQKAAETKGPEVRKAAAKKAAKTRKENS